MATSKLLKIGLVGSVVAAICCFTPVLVLLLGVLGLSGAAGWLDFVLLPALALFLSITVYAFFAQKKQSDRN